mmetsp:Transcript_24596/g.48917  ORF Transcript_24596/g.48917 Transcript_24596/m.48917 type:complete len:208 (+) Transcript_24596:301-924(+)
MPRDPSFFLIDGFEFSESFSDSDLEVSFLVAFSTVAAPLLRVLLPQLQKYHTIRRRQTHIRPHTPLQPQTLPLASLIIHPLGTRKRHPAVRIPVAHNIRTTCQHLPQILRLLPPICAEQQVNRPVVYLGRRLQIPIDEMTDGSGPIGETVGDGGEGEGKEVFDEEGDLGGFAAAVYAFEEDESSSFGRRCGVGCFGDHGVGLATGAK